MFRMVNCNTRPAAEWIVLFFFFNDTATTEIYTLSLHDALPIFGVAARAGDEDGEIDRAVVVGIDRAVEVRVARVREDRKSTRLNSSHANISYAVFCLKKKKTDGKDQDLRCEVDTHTRPDHTTGL